jgi:glycosyltransferase involved in cell wall biosynthesis
VHLGTVPVGREFEFGTPDYNCYIYKKLLLATIPPGTPIILSDDATVWRAAVELAATYPLVGVLHADEDHYYQLAARYNKEVDIFVCVSARVARVVKERTPAIDASRIFVVPCGIALPPMHRAEGRDGWIQMVYVGRITDYQKRSGDLAKVAIALRKRNIPFSLTIIGDGLETRAALEKTVKDQGLSEQVKFTGWLSQAQVHQHLSAADVLLLTSDFEGMPIAMMEGLASGCGFVGTRVSGIEDYEFHALAPDCFRVFGVGDIDGAVAQIVDIAAVNKQQRAIAARKLAESQFSMDICLNNYNKAMNTINTRTYTTPAVNTTMAVKLKSQAVALLRSMKMK